MTKEQLEALGLNEEQIKEVFKLNGIAVNNAKGELGTKTKEVETLQEQLNTANKTIEDFKEMDIEGIKAAADDYKEKYEDEKAKYQEQLEKMQFEHELENAIRDSKAKNIKAVKALLDIDSLRNSKNRADDIKKALEATAEENDFLFATEEVDSPYFTRPTDKSKSLAMTKEDFENLSYIERNELFRTNNKLYNELVK